MGKRSLGRFTQHVCQTGTALALAMLPLTAVSSGFRVPPASAAGLAFANAIVANSEDPGATPYNPAAAAFHSKWIASLGVLPIDGKLTVTNAAGTSESHAPSPSWSYNGFIEGPAFDNVRWSLAFTTPFGQTTNWPVGAFPGFAGPLVAFSPTESKIELYSITPSVAWRIVPSLAVFAALDYYDVRNATLDTAFTNLRGSGDKLSWSVGLMYAEGPWSFGLTYRSHVEVPIDGTLSTPVASASASTTLPLPARAQAGVRYRFNPELAVEVDLDYTGWSRFKSITIEHQNPTPGLPSPIVNTNDWRDTVAVRVGLSYAWRPGTMLRAGYAYEPSAMPDAHFSARDPDARTNSLSIGVGHDVGAWRFDLGYMYVWYDSRTFATSVPFGAYGADPNGTAVYIGTYDNRAQLFAVNVSYRF